MWAGVLPFTSDQVPIVDEVRPGLIVAAGHIFGNAAGPMTGQARQPAAGRSRAGDRHGGLPVGARASSRSRRRHRALVSANRPVSPPTTCALRDVVRRFVDRDVIPTVAERERADAYPADLLPALADLGVLGMSIPEEHGGSELDLVGYALVFEELARGWMGLASVVGSSGSGCWLIGRYGTEEQRRPLPPRPRRRPADERHRADGAVDRQRSQGDHGSRRRRHGDRYVVDGHEDDDHPGPPRRPLGRAGASPTPRPHRRTGA